jgi:hypothetical protein
MLTDLMDLGCDIVYNAPYTPRFNPIEELFGTIKGKLTSQQMLNQV